MTCWGKIKFFGEDGELLSEITYRSKADRCMLIAKRGKRVSGCKYYHIYPTRFKRHYNGVIPDAPVVIERPKAVYSNGTPFGIAKNDP